MDHTNQTGRTSPDHDDIIDLLSDSELEDTHDLSTDENSWWNKAVEKLGIEALKDAGSSNKFVLLLHLLSHASSLGEKTVLFTQCLKVGISLFVHVNVDFEFILHGQWSSSLTDLILSHSNMLH